MKIGMAVLPPGGPCRGRPAPSGSPAEPVRNSAFRALGNNRPVCAPPRRASRAGELPHLLEQLAVYADALTRGLLAQRKTPAAREPRAGIAFYRGGQYGAAVEER